jgi:hypothetical protein
MGVNANTNDYLTGRNPAPFPAGGEVVAVRATLEFGTGDLDQNDVAAMMILPAGCVPVDFLVDGTDIDSSTAAVIFDLGILNTGGTDISTEAADGGGKLGSTTAVATAFSQRLTHYLNAINGVAKSDSDRKIALKVATAPTTAVAGTVGVTMLYRAV